MIELSVLKELEAKAHEAVVTMEFLNELAKNPKPGIEPKDVIYWMTDYSDLCKEIKKLIEEN